MPRLIFLISLISLIFSLIAFAANNDPSLAEISTPPPLASPHDVCAPVYPQGFEASQGRCFIFVQRSNAAMCAISTMLYKAEPMLRDATSVQSRDSLYATLIQSQKTLYATIMQSQKDYVNCIDRLHRPL